MDTLKMISKTKKPSNLGGNKNSTVSRSLPKLSKKIKKGFNKWIIS